MNCIPFSLPGARAGSRDVPPWRILVLALTVTVSGCSLLSREEAGAVDAATPVAVVDFARSRLVAIDFVDAMVQLPELAPARTTLYTTRPRSRFGEILVTGLQDAGYDLRLGEEGASETLDYRMRPGALDEDDPEGSRYTFFVRAGSVRLKRSYRVDVAGIRPLSRMLLHGADASVLESSPSLFGAPPVPEDPRASGAVRGERAARRGVDAPLKRNMYETGRSNYAALLDDHETLRRDVMVFPNDSLHMGRANKRLARRIADAFDPVRDLISVIGCSHGPTALVNGNETLANGRSYRVKEELMLAGIDADLVLEEGCWAGTHFDRMPARGVVVTHKRRTAG